MDLSFLVTAVKPYLSKIGEGLFSMDKEYGSKDVCILITKKMDEHGKVHTFMSHIERPTNLSDLYVKDKEGKKMVKDIDGLVNLLTGEGQ